MSPRFPVLLLSLTSVIPTGPEGVVGRGAIFGLPCLPPVWRPACATSPSPHP